ncbi:MAG: hypothetical protein ACMG6H_02640 [Acidobacteriota bacterium]
MAIPKMSAEGPEWPVMFTAVDRNQPCVMVSPKSPVVQETAGISASFVSFLPASAILNGKAYPQNIILSMKDISVFVVAPDLAGKHTVVFASKFTTWNWTGYDGANLTFQVNLKNAVGAVIATKDIVLNQQLCTADHSQVFDTPYSLVWEYTPVVAEQIVTCEVLFASTIWKHCWLN